MKNTIILLILIILGYRANNLQISHDKSCKALKCIQIKCSRAMYFKPNTTKLLLIKSRTA